MGDPWRAERLQREALAIARDRTTPRDLFATLNNLVAVLIGAYDLQRGAEVPPEAHAALERTLPLAHEAVGIATELGDPFMPCRHPMPKPS